MKSPWKRFPRSNFVTSILVLLLTYSSIQAVLAEETAQNEEDQLDPNRYEPAILPALSGNSDVGFIFGVFGVLAKFEPNYEPYRWRGQLIAVMSVKSGPEGAELPTHFYQLGFDVPGLAGGRLRLEPSASFSRVITGGYYGLGNGSNARIHLQRNLNAGVPGRHNQYIMAMPKAGLETRLSLKHSFDLRAGLGFKYAMPELYAGSQLAIDAGTGDGEVVVRGTENHANLHLALGGSFDSRDHETVPTRGMYHTLSFRLSPGPVVDTNYLFAGITLDTRFYYPLFSDYLVMAGRLKGDIIMGEAPFYELGSMGAFDTMGFSGSRGVRGLPAGRYHGKAKLLGNFELRSMFIAFALKKQRFRIGAAGFFDTGRVFAALESRPDLDGTNMGLKLGTGGGLRIQWGETLIIRFDVAYSPDTTDANPDMPVGIYMDMAHIF